MDALFEKQALECRVWDLYQDAYGKRPTHLDLSKMPVASLNRLVALLKEVRSLRSRR